MAPRPTALRRLASVAAATITVSAVTFIAGCATWSTWPPERGATSLANPRFSPMPQLMALAVADGVEQGTGSPEAIRFNLPEDTPVDVWEEVQMRLGTGAEPARDGAESVVHVTKIRVSGFDAEVDTVREGGDAPILTTLVFSRRTIGDWRIDRRRIWRFDVDAPALAWVDPVEEVVPSDEVADASVLAGEESAVEPPAAMPAADGEAAVASATEPVATDADADADAEVEPEAPVVYLPGAGG